MAHRENLRCHCSKIHPLQKIILGESFDIFQDLEKEVFQELRKLKRRECEAYIIEFTSQRTHNRIEIQDLIDKDPGGSFWWSEESRLLALTCAITRPPTSLKAEIANILYKNFEQPFDGKVTIFTNTLKGNPPKALANRDKEFLSKFENFSFEESLELLKKFITENSEHSEKYLSELQEALDKEEYSKAFKRYDSLFDRTYQRVLSWLCLEYYFLDNNFGFHYIDPEDDNRKEDIAEKNREIAAQNFYMPKGEDFEKPVDFLNNLEDKVIAFYKDKKDIMAYNIVLEHWLVTLKKGKATEKPYNQFRTIFKEHFNEVLPKKWFYKEFFGKNDDIRCCRYCEITEPVMNEMRDIGLFVTKRLYVKGQSMEIDQLDAYKGYSKDNIALVCYWCNNAKTDEFTDEEFKPIGQQIKEIWKQRRNNKIKMAS